MPESGGVLTGIDLDQGEVTYPGPGCSWSRLPQQKQVGRDGYPVRREDAKCATPEIAAGTRTARAGRGVVGKRPEQKEAGEGEEHGDTDVEPG